MKVFHNLLWKKINSVRILVINLTARKSLGFFVRIINFVIKKTSSTFESFIDGEKIAALCDVSFGDHAGIQAGCPGAKYEIANLNNKRMMDLLNKRNLVRKSVTTIFIDGFRLMSPEINTLKHGDQDYAQNILDRNEIMKVVESFSPREFVIFSSLDDTTITKQIESRMPKNLLAIVSTNVEKPSGRLIAMPLGIQRKMKEADYRQEYLRLARRYVRERIKPRNLMYVNFNENNNGERKQIASLFENEKWVLVRNRRVHASRFYLDILASYFVLCPPGNGIDCHREWETLLLGRVPIILESELSRELHKNNPVLFVNNFNQVSEEMLKDNLHIFEKAHKNKKNMLEPNLIFSEKLLFAKRMPPE